MSEVNEVQFQDPSVLEVGTILRRSWGYEQTNVNFYVVDRVTKTMVTFHEVGKTLIDGDGWTGRVVPNTDEATGEPIRRKFHRSGSNGEIWIRMNSYSGARVWSGVSERMSSYA